MHINPVAVSIFGFDIMWYGVVIALGVIAAMCICLLREKHFGFPKDSSLSLILVALPLGILFARLYFVIFNLHYYMERPKEILAIRNGGLAIYGGIIGGVTGLFLYSRKKRISFLKILDFVVPAVVIAQAVGRWGNFFNSEAFGTETDIHIFPVSVFIEADGKWHLATFFYESCWCLLTGLFLLIAEKKDFFQKTGHEVLTYFLLYATERICVEGLRTDSLFLGPIRVSQLLSAILLCMSIFLLLKHKRNAVCWLMPVLGILASVIVFSPIPLFISFPLIFLVSAAALFAYRCVNE